MSAYTGKQFKGAAKVRKAQKRKEAESRNASATVRWFMCGHKHAFGKECA